MRVCAVSLPELRIELVEEAAPRGSPRLPLAVVVAPPPMVEGKLLGSTRISVVSREARALGIVPGQTIAEARARVAHLAVRVVGPDAVRDVLARIAEVGLAFGATVSFGMEKDPRFSNAESRNGDLSSFGDVVWIDVTGCAHLHAPSSSDPIDVGEAILASRLARAIASIGHRCSIAIADGPRIAAMIARARLGQSPASKAKTRRVDDASEWHVFEPFVVRPSENAAAIAELSVAELPLPPEDVRWLAQLGVRTIREMRALPREGLGTRLGPRARTILALAFGEDRAPLHPYVPPEIPEEIVALEYGIEGAQALTFVAKTLTDRLSARLRGRAVAAARLELELRLDAAMLLNTDRLRSATELVLLDLPAPLSSSGDLLAALRPKIERLVLCAPVLGVKLRAPVLVRARSATLSLFEPQPQAERVLPRLVAELVSDLGSSAVSTLELGDSWVPDDRSRFVPVSISRNGQTDNKPRAKTKTRRHMLSSVPEPTRVLAEPHRVARENVRIMRHLSRLESTSWWKKFPRGQSESSRDAVDYVQAWTDEGVAWVSIDRGTGAMHVRGWFD